MWNLLYLKLGEDIRLNKMSNQSYQQSFIASNIQVIDRNQIPIPILYRIRAFLQETVWEDTSTGTWFRVQHCLQVSTTEKLRYIFRIGTSCTLVVIVSFTKLVPDSWGGHRRRTETFKITLRRDILIYHLVTTVTIMSKFRQCLIYACLQKLRKRGSSAFHSYSRNIVYE